ncbi:hypothetical protein A2863_02395 [Candidatus Woesebacteria bacterium RIFCSPHIGHO2_01_FULL_38_9b]|uniref:DUF5667 domain-containing protein n=1 Tax=Candidatus Woesebacteria bacterium RIFCSPHIGHO2_01_FULL_38_9b TaxID=1802493 RepID=A0A1F7XYA4_9BACT|nr:MAG: hypothetical protein A2863_02395 [Candidatus Woesebacteria bacterium RIFCSPHIGHO2_01_FULL_38_9b]
MKTIIKLSIIYFVILLLTPSFVNAQTPTLSRTQIKQPTIRQMKVERQLLLEQKRLELQERLQDKKASREAQLNQKRQDRIKKYWGMLEKRLNAAIERLERLVNRLDSRIAKIKSSGEDIDASEEESVLLEAKQKLTDAKAQLEIADSMLDEVLTSQNPKEAFDIIRETVKDIKSDLIEIHRMLVQVIGDLKGLRVGNSVTATPSAEPAISE